MNIENPNNQKKSGNKLSRPAIEALESRALFAAGLAGTYFSDAALDAVAFTRVDPNIAFNWGARSPGAPIAAGSPFSARWTGSVTAPRTGAYTIRERASDGIRVWIDGNLLIDD